MYRLICLLFLAIFSSIAQGKCDASSQEKFQDFFLQFASSKSFATSRTIYPHVVIRHEYGVDERGREVDEKVKTIVTKQMDESYPALFDYMKTNALKYKQKSLSASKATVEIFKPDSDWLLSYYFKRKGKCWYLAGVEDHSL